ncbi:hypothetical protein ADIWIN_0748 [Winogradskyella psychrotolerans RS-3]|uniref:Uncharacterized protein n=2 Tax=Winogradskyella TaxID=286104 RepID=S7VVQ7_9FLAO|nr:hypothetical protein ADIWIN_0748 [Winogradskyella psychrotolerans RS-3]
MITESRTSKYLLYGIGEIILVVIGILIALQINNWNEHSKQNQIEHQYLMALKEEFNHNTLKLKQVIATNKANADNALKISDLMGPETPEITEKEFSKLAMNMTNWEVMYHPNQAVLDEIISSGKLSIFSNATLKFALSSSKGILSRVKFQEEEHSVVRMQVIELMNAKGNAKRMIIDAQGDTFDIKPSKFELGNLQLLQSQELENELMDFILTARYLNQNYYSELKKEIENILELIDKELE